jgi:hypothetical protein
LCLPGFFLSTFLESLVKNQAALRIFLKPSSFSAKLLANQSLTASACDETQEPIISASK